MAFNLNTKGRKGYSEYTGRAPAPCPGTFHVSVENATELAGKNGKDPSLEVEFVVLCDRGTTPGQAGKIHKEFFALNDKDFNVQRLARLAMILGLIGPDEEKEVDFSKAKGQQLVITLKEDTFQGVTRVKIDGMNFWPTDDPIVKERNFPLEESMLGYGRPAAAPAAPTNGSGSQQAPAPAAPVSAAGGKWDNL